MPCGSSAAGWLSLRRASGPRRVGAGSWPSGRRRWAARSVASAIVGPPVGGGPGVPGARPRRRRLSWWRLLRRPAAGRGDRGRTAASAQERPPRAASRRPPRRASSSRRSAPACSRARARSSRAARRRVFFFSSASASCADADPLRVRPHRLAARRPRSSVPVALSASAIASSHGSLKNSFFCWHFDTSPASATASASPEALTIFAEQVVRRRPRLRGEVLDQHLDRRRRSCARSVAASDADRHVRACSNAHSRDCAAFSSTAASGCPVSGSFGTSTPVTNRCRNAPYSDVHDHVGAELVDGVLERDRRLQVGVGLAEQAGLVLERDHRHDAERVGVLGRRRRSAAPTRSSRPRRRPALTTPTSTTASGR